VFLKLKIFSQKHNLQKDLSLKTNMSLGKLIKTGKSIAREISSQHSKTVAIRKQLVVKNNIRDYHSYQSFISKLKKAEKHEQKLEKQWWDVQDKIRVERRKL